MRLILDSMVWTYIAERKERDALEELEIGLGVDLVVPPSILLEALRTPVAEPRAAIVAAITARGSARTHPAPEAKLEADEVVAEVRRRRSSWTWKFPKTDRLSGLEAFWTRRLWQQAARNPSSVAEHASATTTTDDDIKSLNEHQAILKTASKDAGVRFGQDQPWADLGDSEPQLREVWEGGRIEVWRVDNAFLWWHHLVEVPKRARARGGDTTFADWTRPWLKLSAIARVRNSWNHFWYHEVDAAAVPRNWIHAMLPWVQLRTKLGSGNPGDTQHAPYLFDADLFVTADRRYRNCLETLRPWAPQDFADVYLAPGHGPIVPCIESAVSRAS